MRWLPWKRTPRRLDAAREWQRAERRQRAEYEAAVRRIIESAPSWNGPTGRFQAAPLLTRGQDARTTPGGRR